MCPKLNEFCPNFLFRVSRNCNFLPDFDFALRKIREKFSETRNLKFNDNLAKLR